MFFPQDQEASADADRWWTVDAAALHCKISGFAKADLPLISI